MPFSRYEPSTRVPSEKVVMRNNQFARWVGKRTGVSHQALSKAIQLISTGLLEALASGYEVSLTGIGTFEVRELKPRKRYHRLEHRVYISEPSSMVHFRKSEQLTKRVKQLAAEYLEAMTDTPSVTPTSK